VIVELSVDVGVGFRDLDSKPLREIRLIEPPRPAAGMSGVGTLVTSTRETLFIGISRRSSERLLPPKDVAISPPSSVRPELFPGKPRNETVVGSEPEVAIETPGRKSRNSPIFSLPRSPNSSMATTLLRLGALRCSFIEIACALISRSAMTVNASSLTA
jgi:hypothetical protein